MNKPQVLLADEPTGNLDPATSAGIMAVLERINAGGTTVLMATHEAGIVDQMKRRVIELVNGQIVRDERHGGYGFTAAIPTAHVAVPMSRRFRHGNTRRTRLPLHQATGPAPSVEPGQPVEPRRSLLRCRRPPPAASEPEPTLRGTGRTGAAIRAGCSSPSPRRRTTPGRPPCSAHFAAPRTQPVMRPRLADHELPDQLSFAAKLGLRAPGGNDDEPGEQNVGPTK